MKKISSAGLIRFSDLARSVSATLWPALAFILFPALLIPCSYADDFSSEVRTTLPPDALESAQDAADRFQNAVPPEALSRIPERSSGLVKQELHGQAERTDTGSCDDVQSSAGSSPGNHFHGEADKIFYFFSFSMPETSLKRVLADAVRINSEGRQTAILVLRGLVQNNLKSTISAFYRLIREAGIGTDLPVEIDPNLYEKHSISEVPAIVYQSRRGTGVLRGDVGLSHALSRLEEKLTDHGKIGVTYPIGEESILQVMESKKALVEKRVKERMAAIAKASCVLRKYDGTFEKANEDRIYHVDPSVVLANDIRDHEGRVLFSKGSRFYPSDHASLGRYIIIDGRDPAQVDFALQGNYRKVILLSGDLAELTQKHRKRFYFAVDEIVERLKIRRVPAIVEQEGQFIRVTEKAV